MIEGEGGVKIWTLAGGAVDSDAVSKESFRLRLGVTVFFFLTDVMKMCLKSRRS